MAAKTYSQIKASCLQSGTKWEDPDFPANDCSISYKSLTQRTCGAQPIDWLRPGQIFTSGSPQMFVAGMSRMDVNQGSMGDCWLLSAVACIATNDKLVKRIVPTDQSFQDGYAGIFRFELWQYGHWVEVLVDDRLPTRRGSLIFMHSTDKNEFWSALLEKAYAKVNGSYEALNGGWATDALEDFTGGLAARFDLRDKAPPDLFQTLVKAIHHGSFMSCSIDGNPAVKEQEQANGLIMGHAYSITDVETLDVGLQAGQSTKINMVRVRNPWGGKHEWKGAWSDGAREWDNIPPEEKQRFTVVKQEDGEFWMSFDDFVSNYQRFGICYLDPKSRVGEFDEQHHNVKWVLKQWDGSWKAGVNAGGHIGQEQFWTNPQYKITIEDPDPTDADGNGTVVVGVMQKGRRKLRCEGKTDLAIGYYIFNPQDVDNKRAAPVCKTDMIATREVSNYHKLPPGNYVVIPCTWNVNDEIEFLIRTFIERKAS